MINDSKIQTQTLKGKSYFFIYTNDFDKVINDKEIYLLSFPNVTDADVTKGDRIMNLTKFAASV